MKMIDNCITIAINMRKCARDHQSANIGGGLFDPSELGAAANKIETACDLLAALEAMVFRWEMQMNSRGNPDYIAARAAIAKAKGD